MRYYLDTEFIEGFRKPWFERKRHFIDLISIGLVSEKGEEFYEISKEFDLNYIWDNEDPWVKDNVLKKIHNELCRRMSTYAKTYHPGLFEPFTKKSMRFLLDTWGKTEAEIKDGLLKYFRCSPFHDDSGYWMQAPADIEVWAYFADYDWVVMCSVFGRMIDLPKDFPMYCLDLKQKMHQAGLSKEWKQRVHPDPKGEHNALVDAKWNLELDWKINEYILAAFRDHYK